MKMKFGMWVMLLSLLVVGVGVCFVTTVPVKASQFIYNASFANYLATANITNLVGNPTSTSILLSWQKVTGTNNTTVTYRTNTFPSMPTDGTIIYTGGEREVTISGLIAGQPYYIAAWGGIPSSFTSPPAFLMINTLAVDIPSGAAEVPAFDPPNPTLSPSMAQNPVAPVSGTFGLFPFNIIVSRFATEGLGMPIENAWEWLAAFGITIVGITTYSKVRNFFVAYSVVFVLIVFAIGLHLMQGWVIFPMLAIGAGVWMIDRWAQ